ncbi:MAG: hypothetical protein FK733_00635 [Asgard group archaeon]|nr:hypothetical protein [Asgard group archaeon]
MVSIEWLSFGFSAVAVIISAGTAVASLIIAWLNHKKSFDPLIIIDSEKNPEYSDVSIKEVCIRNVGRGTAYLVELKFYDAKGTKYILPPIDLVTPDEVCFIQKSNLYNNNGEKTDLTIPKLKGDKIFVMINYENEGGGKKRDHYFTTDFDYFRVLSRFGFRKMLREVKKK